MRGFVKGINMVPDRFPTALRGYDKDKVNEAFTNYERTISRLREQVRSSDESILQLQAQLQEEKNNVIRAKSGNTFASLGANAQQLLASAEQTSAQLIERAKQDAASIKKKQLKRRQELC